MLTENEKRKSSVCKVGVQSKTQCDDKNRT